jgi:hypothetical protein
MSERKMLRGQKMYFNELIEILKEEKGLKNEEVTTLVDRMKSSIQTISLAQ